MNSCEPFSLPRSILREFGNEFQWCCGDAWCLCGGGEPGGAGSVSTHEKSCSGRNVFLKAVKWCHLQTADGNLWNGRIPGLSLETKVAKS